MLQIIILVTLLISWYISYRMAKSEGDVVIGYRNDEIASLKKQIEATDKWTDTLFNESDMLRISNAAYLAGLRVDKEWSGEKWIDKTFRKPESPVGQYADHVSVIGDAITEPEHVKGGGGGAAGTSWNGMNILVEPEDSNDYRTA